MTDMPLFVTTTEEENYRLKKLLTEQCELLEETNSQLQAAQARIKELEQAQEEHDKQVKIDAINELIGGIKRVNGYNAVDLLDDIYEHLDQLNQK